MLQINFLRRLYKNGIYKTAIKLVWKFLYNASLENKNDLEERDRLIERVKEIDTRIKQRNLIMTGLLKGILSQNKKAPQSEQIKLINGGDEMKYRGITIHKNKTCSTWYARYTDNGKQVYISSKTQKDCFNKLKIAINKKEQKQIDSLKKERKKKEPKSMTFMEWFNKWLELYKKDVKQRTIKDYKCSLNYLESIFNKPMNYITSIEIIEILNKIDFERRKQMVYELLRSLFDTALKNDIISKDIILNIPKPKHIKKKGNALTNRDEVELERVLKESKADMFLVCLYQGLRRGEMLALTNDDIDYNNKTLHINKSLSQYNTISTTKNVYSNRIMPLFDKTIEILKKYENKQGRIFDIGYLTCERNFREIIRISKVKQNIQYTA